MCVYALRIVSPVNILVFVVIICKFDAESIVVPKAR